jgi:uridine kinase
MKTIFIGIAGGTGAGKSTLCSALVARYPEQIGLVQLDDYFKPASEVPKFEGHTNYDHPDALYIDKLAADIEKLSKGKSTVINTKNELLNPDYKKTGTRVPIEFKPRPVMLVEGYLVLFDERIRKFLSTSVWLEAGHDLRWSRRAHFKNSEYEEKVLLPMHKKYAEPTKQYARHIINVSSSSKEQVLDEAESIIKKFL